jgi:hypothetical protein
VLQRRSSSAARKPCDLLTKQMAELKTSNGQGENRVFGSKSTSHPPW